MGDSFKVGDRVIATKTCTGAMSGEEYTVTKHSNGTLNIAQGCCCSYTWKKVTENGKGGSMTKNVLEVIVVDTLHDEIIVKEIVMTDTQEAAFNKISMTHATKLKAIPFDNLAYIARPLGSYESKEKKD